MPWLELESSEYFKAVPPCCLSLFSRVISLRSSPKLLVAVCGLQMLVLLVGLLQQLGRVECSIAVPSGGPVEVECDTCHERGLSLRTFLLHVGGAVVIGTGLLAVHWRNQQLLYVYGTVMLFFSVVVGLTAMLTALETPVLEVAVENISPLDEACYAQAEIMLQTVRDHTTLTSLACLVDTFGALFAIRSRELFGYEEIATAHAEIARAAQPL